MRQHDLFHFRYDLLDETSGAGLDREAVQSLLAELRAWAESKILVQ